MNKAVKTFDGLDHQNAPDTYLHEIDPQTVLTMGATRIDPVAYNQWHKRKMAYIKCSLSGIAFN